MTTQQLTEMALPYVRHTLTRAQPLVIERLGHAAWLALWPAWGVVTGPLLPTLVRLGIELAIGLAATRLLPILGALDALATYLSETYFTAADKALLTDLERLLATSRAAMLDPVRDTLALPPGAVAAASDAD